MFDFAKQYLLKATEALLNFYNISYLPDMFSFLGIYLFLTMGQTLNANPGVC